MTTDRRLARFAIVIAGMIVFGGLLALTLNELDRSTRTETTSYVVNEDGTVSTGNYCTKDGTVLDGGRVCQVVKTEIPISQQDHRQETITNAIILALVGGVIFAVLWYATGTPVNQAARSTH